MTRLGLRGRRGIASGVVALGVLAGGAVATGATQSAPGRAHAAAMITAAASSSTMTPATSHPRATASLRLGSRGPAVRTLQQRLSTLGYWLGPPDGVFGALTQQAVYALQKAASLVPDGVVGPRTSLALARGVRPRPRSTTGYLVEINLRTDLLMIVRNAKVLVTFNTSTGGGYSYVSDGVRAIATTPRGVFRILRQVNGLVVAPLGELWRPKYFVGGYAIHGSASVPPVPVSHGCVRLTNQAIDWVWASNRMPIGTKVWIY